MLLRVRGCGALGQHAFGLRARLGARAGGSILPADGTGLALPHQRRWNTITSVGKASLPKRTIYPKQYYEGQGRGKFRRNVNYRVKRNFMVHNNWLWHRPRGQNILRGQATAQKREALRGWTRLTTGEMRFLKIRSAIPRSKPIDFDKSHYGEHSDQRGVPWKSEVWQRPGPDASHPQKARYMRPTKYYDEAFWGKMVKTW